MNPKPSAADQLPLLPGMPAETVWQVGPRAARATGPKRADWPEAWNADRPAKVRGLERAEKWTVAEAAFWLRCSPDHVLNLIYDGTITAHNIARLPTSVPLYRVSRDSVLAFEKSRAEGAGE